MWEKVAGTEKDVVKPQQTVKMSLTDTLLSSMNAHEQSASYWFSLPLRAVAHTSCFKSTDGHFEFDILAASTTWIYLNSLGGFKHDTRIDFHSSLPIRI